MFQFLFFIFFKYYLQLQKPNYPEIIGSSGEYYNVVYHSLSQLNEPHPNLTIALICVHGSGVDPNSTYNSCDRAAKNENLSSDQYYIISPEFFEDGLSTILPNETYWNSNWRYGSFSNINNSYNGISSFSILDYFILFLNQNKNLYPKLNRIIITGHSAGGQVTARYWSVSWIKMKDLRFKILFIPANPSSYTYLSSIRPEYNFPPSQSIDYQYISSYPNSTQLSLCKSYDRYPYGINGTSTTFIYANYSIYNGIISQIQFERPLGILLGENDTCNDDPNVNYPPGCNSGGLSIVCSSYLQGPERRTRGLAYFQDLKRIYNNNLELITYKIVPGVSHSSRTIYSEEGRYLLFRWNPNINNNSNNSKIYYYIISGSLILIIIIIILIFKFLKKDDDSEITNKNII